jgi:DNA-binding SARP family transcriptional activator/tetratricopeptide (TPR) repeat protein
MVGQGGPPALRFELLGPMRAWQGDTELNLGPVQQQVVLAALVLNANRPVGRDQLIDAVWGPDAPAYAVNLLQKHVSALRRILDPVRSAREPSKLLSWTGAGYLLTMPADHIDIEMFDREVRRARAARATGDLTGAADALHTALGAWRGPACDGLYSPLVDAERQRLAERRVCVLEERIEVDLAVGRHSDLVAELRRLVADFPLRETLSGLLMLALYRSGRQAEALAAFQDTRRRLRDELGLDPTPQLQRLHERILAGDPTVAVPEGIGPAPAAVAARAAPGGAIEAAEAAVAVRADGAAEAEGAVRADGAAEAIATGEEAEGTEATDSRGADRGAAAADRGSPLPVPAQLPSAMPDFTGRDAELDRLHALLAGSAEAVVISAIAGTAGVGKSALAVHWAHQVKDRFPDGQLYVNLRGFDRSGSAMDPAEAIRGFLDAFGIPPQRIPVSREAQAGLYRSLLAGRRILVVLDNAENSEQIRPLLPGTPECLVLVTSRNQLTGLVATEGAQAVALDLLSTAEARQLLVRRLGPDRVAAEPEAVDEIITLCARLPLALAVAAARAATRPQFPLALLAAELHETRGGLDAFDGEDLASDVRAVFSWSYQRLSENGSRLFRLLGLHPGPHIATEAAASLAGVPPARVRPMLAELARVHLVCEFLPARFTCHDLLRAYAAELAETRDTEETRNAAIHRMLDHYIHTAHTGDRLLSPRLDQLELSAPQPGSTPVQLTDAAAAQQWFATEHLVLLDAVDHAARAGFDAQVGQLVWGLRTYLDRGGHWHDHLAVQRTALEASQRLGDRAGLAHALRGLAQGYTRLGRFANAHEAYRRALERYEELGDQRGQAHTHRNLAWVLERQGRHAEALPHAERALDLFLRCGHRAGQADALNAVGWFHTQLGDHGRALRYCQQALELHRQIGHLEGEAHTWDSIGFAHFHLNAYKQAAECYQRAISLWRELGNRYFEAGTLAHFGDMQHSIGDLDAARESWHSAWRILDTFDHPDARGVLDKLAQLDQLDQLDQRDQRDQRDQQGQAPLPDEAAVNPHT